MNSTAQSLSLRNATSLDANNNQDQPINRQNSTIQETNRYYHISDRYYQYRGPECQEIRELLDLLEALQSDQNQESFYQRSIQYFNRINLAAAEKLKVPFDKIVVALGFAIAYSVALYEAFELEKAHVRGNSQILLLFPVYVSIYSIILLVISLFDIFENALVWIIGFPLLLVTPLLVLLSKLGLLSEKSADFDYDYHSIASTCLIGIIYVGGLTSRSIQSWFSARYHKIIGALMATQFCFLIPFGLLLKVLVYIFSTKILALEDVKTIIGGPIFICLFYISAFSLIRLFSFSPGEILQQIHALRDKINIIKKEEPERADFENLFQGHLITAPMKISKICLFLFSAIYVALELTVYIKFLQQFSEPTFNIERTIMFGVLMVFIPLHVIIGVVMTNSETNFIDLSFFYPFVFSMLQILATWAHYQFGEQTFYEPITILILISPTLMTCLWGTVAFFKNVSFSSKCIAQTFSCYFVAFPLGFLLTISQGLDEASAYQAASVIIIVGSVPVAIYCFYWIFIALKVLSRLPEQSRSLNFSSYKSYDFRRYAAWVNAMLYTISFYILLYEASFQPIGQSSTTKGMIRGLLGLHPMLFFTFNVLLRVKKIDEQMYENERKGPQYHISMGSLFFVIVPFIVLLPIALTLEEAEKQTLLSLAVGIPLISGLFKLLLATKNKSGDYEQFLLPILKVVIWIFAILPFGLVIPVFANRFKKEQIEFIYLAQISVAYGLMFCIFSVTTISLFFSILMNKEYLELKKRAVVTKVMELLARYRISSSVDTCSQVFMKFVVQRDMDKFKTNLQNGNPVNLLDYNGSIGHFYSQTLVTKEEFENFHGKQRQIKRRDTVGGSLIIQNPHAQKTFSEILTEYLYKFGYLCLDCFFCRCGQDQLEQDEQREKDLNHELQELEEKEVWRLSETKFKVPTVQEERTLLRGNDYYSNLQKMDDRTERFWLTIYNAFREDLNPVFNALHLDKNQVSWVEFPSYQCLEGKIVLSIEDFAKLFQQHLTTHSDYPYEDLKELAVLKYALFVHNFQDLKQKLLIKPNEETPFTKSIYIQNFKPENLRNLVLSPERLSRDLNLEYQQKRKEVKERFASNLSNCEKETFQFFKKVNYMIWVWPFVELKRQIEQSLEKLQFTVRPHQFENIEQVKEEKTPWDKVYNLVADKFKTESENFEIEIKNKNLSFHLNLSNLMATINRLLDLFGLASLAFDNSVGWTEGAYLEEFSPSNYFLDFQIIRIYYFHFFFALFLSIMYAFLGREAVQEISQNTFGRTKEGNPATWRDRSFWVSKLIIFISGQFLYVMKTFIDAFVCNYDIPGDYRLSRHQDITCMDDSHYLFVSLAFVGAFFYYPLSTFLQPTFQYSDQSLDLKYNSSYIVIYTQVKLLIIGATSVFNNLKEESFQYQLLFADIVVLCLVYYYYENQPCYVKWINFIELAILTCIFFSYIGAMVIIFSGSREAGWIITIAACAVVFMLLVIKLLSYYREGSVRVNPKKGDEEERNQLQVENLQ